VKRFVFLLLATGVLVLLAGVGIAAAAGGRVVVVVPAFWGFKEGGVSGSLAGGGRYYHSYERIGPIGVIRELDEDEWRARYHPWTAR
jgi:hypothetical protein